MKPVCFFVVFAVLSPISMAISNDDSSERLKIWDVTLPGLEERWEKLNEGSKPPYAWVNFTGSNDDVLSFCAWKVNQYISLESSPVLQSSIELFASNGRARVSNSSRGEPIMEMVRHRIVEVKLGGVETQEPIEAIEYSYLYGQGVEEPVSIGHGYLAKIGETIVSVQHTSRNPISSELAFDMICQMLAKQYGSKSYGKGAVRRIELK